MGAVIENKFYVYEHWRPDKDACFYVGLGQGRRANVMYKRDSHHHGIQKKLAKMGMCVEVRLVIEGLSREEASLQERRRIAFWKAMGVSLVNRTDGGETGFSPGEETRALMRAKKLGRTLTEEHKARIGESTRKALNTPEMKQKLSEAIKLAKSTPEAKAKMSKYQKTRVRSKEQYENISKALTGRKLSPEHAAKSRVASLGRKQTPEEIERRRAANKGRKRTPEFCELMKKMAAERAARRSAAKSSILQES